MNDVKTLLAIAALHHRDGQTELSSQLLSKACTLEGFNSFVDEVIRRPMNSALVGGVPQSENTIAPSLHGGVTSLEKAVAIAADIYSCNSMLDHGDYLEFSPSAEALAYADGQDDNNDDDELVSMSSDVEPPKFGKIKIKL